ncbi:ribonuclease HII [Candidatus Gracilibacteria bacterium]|nr:ribonuclease HII [Candidatus Gracilibacteria bacterium]
MRTSALEKQLYSEGHFIVGVDEVGCGCVAGPVVAAAVILPLGCRIGNIADSKSLSGAKRKTILLQMLEANISISWGVSTVEEVERFNVRQASIMAMKRALDLLPQATYALIDAWNVPGLEIPQKGIIKGDAIIRCIGAASIAAKVVRDHLMCEYGREFPQYEFERHKGYGTALHMANIKKHGLSTHHRPSFLRSVISDNAN